MNKQFQIKGFLTLVLSILSPLTLINAQHARKAYGIINTVEQFKNLIASSIPTVIKFSAPWCGPCKHMEPAYDTIANQYSPNVKFYEVNTSSAQLQPLVKQYNIQGLPTIAYFHQGKEVMRDRKGALTKQELNSSVKQFLNKVGKTPQAKFETKVAPTKTKPQAKRVAPKTTVTTVKVKKPSAPKPAVKAQPKKRIVKKIEQTVCY